MTTEQQNALIVFENKKIRRTWHNDEWYFSVVDVVEVLTESSNPRDYWYKMKIRVQSEDGVELSTNCRQFKLEAPDGKMRETDCANTETLFRIIQSTPSSKAEPFKRWLAKMRKGQVTLSTNQNQIQILLMRLSQNIFFIKNINYRWL